MHVDLVSGTVVGRTGRYKIFPVVGGAVMALGLYLLSRLDADTPYWQMASAMLVLGLGIGSSMQVLTIVVQSTAAYEDLGVATSGVTFFRTLGSSFGAAVFGTVYANVLNDTLPAAVAASPGVDPAAVTTPAALHAYPADADRADRRRLRARAARRVPGRRARCRWSRSSWRCSSRRSRCAARRASTATDVGEGFGMPEGDRREPAAPAGRRAAAAAQGPHRSCRGSASAPGRVRPADGWAVGQVYLRSRLGRTDRPRGDQPTLPSCRPRSSSPPSTEPSATATSSGTATGSLLTEPARTEIRKVVTALRAWLAEELTDWGVDDAQFAAALGDVATKFVEESPELTPAPSRAIAGGPSS